MVYDGLWNGCADEAKRWITHNPRILHFINSISVCLQHVAGPKAEPVTKTEKSSKPTGQTFFEFQLNVFQCILLLIFSFWNDLFSLHTFLILFTLVHPFPRVATYHTIPHHTVSYPTMSYHVLPSSIFTFSPFPGIAAASGQQAKTKEGWFWMGWEPVQLGWQGNRYIIDYNWI